jgi:cytochrome P450 family 130
MLSFKARGYSMTDTLQSGKPDLEEDFDPITEEDVAAKHATMREQCPVAHVRNGAAHFWALTRFTDVTSAARDTVGFANGKRMRFKSRRPPLESDPPEHTQWRKLLNPFFLPRRIEETFEPISRQLAVALIEPLIAAGGGDMARDLARPLPPQVLLSFLGQPAADWETVKDCCELAYLDRSDDPADRAKFDAANAALWDYSRDAVTARIETRADPATDLIAALLAGARDLENCNELVAGVVRLLLAAGHDSTTSALSICLHYLARSPEDQARLRAEPAKLRPAIEEMLRFETPVIAMPRIIARDTQIGGRSLSTGDRAMLYYAAANRDGAAFPDPDRCLIDRSPNPHLAFGTGIHSCVGAPLARQEIRVVLEELLARTRLFTLAGPVAREFWHPYGLRYLPLYIERA